MTAGEKFLAEYESRVATIRAAVKAKARVRDAAPDLLAALKELVDTYATLCADYNMEGRGHLDPETEPAVIAARAALAKAGEWPTEDGDQ